MGSPLAARLTSDDRRPTVTAFPDGSVDYFYDVFDGQDRITRRDRYAEAIASGHSPAFTVRRRSVEPGGHAVNMAVQADLLGDAVTLVGHLDDPEFSSLSFETDSMGSPARIAIYTFDDGDVLMAKPSRDILSWSFDDLTAAVEGSVKSLLSADVLFCTNWTTFDALPEALGDLAAVASDGGYFLFDPGSLSHRSDEEVERLFDALADLADVYDVVLAANGGEVEFLATAVDDDVGPSDHAASLECLRTAGGLAGAVLHEADVAVAVTPEDTVRVENVEVEPVRNTGGGDRFDAGLSHALARDWSWTDALRLGNACASRYIATGESGTPEELASFIRQRE